MKDAEDMPGSVLRTIKRVAVPFVIRIDRTIERVAAVPLVIRIDWIDRTIERVAGPLVIRIDRTA